MFFDLMEDWNLDLILKMLHDLEARTTFMENITILIIQFTEA